MRKTAIINVILKILIIIFIFSGLLYATDKKSVTAEKIYQRGLKKYIYHKYPAAIKDFENAHRLSSKEKRIIKMLVNALIKEGNIQLEQGKNSKSLKLFMKALSYSSGHKELTNLFNLTINSISESKSSKGSSTKRKKYYKPRPRQKIKVQKGQLVASSTVSQNWIAWALLLMILFILISLILYLFFRQDSQAQTNANLQTPLLPTTHPPTPLATAHQEREKPALVINTSDSIFTPDNAEWRDVRDYVNKLSHRKKVDVLELVSEKLEDPNPTASQNAFEVLLPFFQDSHSDIRQNARTLLKRAAHYINFHATSDEEKENEKCILLSKLIDLETSRYGHSSKVADLVRECIETLEPGGIEKSKAVRSALLHDIGFLAIDELSFMEKQVLEPVEFDVVKKHTELAKSILIKYKLTSAVYLEAIMHHHERLNATGYYQKDSSEISFLARIICVADVYEAMTSERPYRKAYSEEETISYLKSQSNTLFDSRIVSFFEDRHLQIKEVKLTG